MSYAAVGQIGIQVRVDPGTLFTGPKYEGGAGATRPFCPPPMFSASGNGPKALCNGGIHATNCKSVCCTLDSWTNNTYRDVKGQDSFQKLNEDRIMHLFALIFTGSAGGENRVQEFAYDRNASVAPTLLSSINGSFTRYFKIFQPSRWVALPGPPKSCDGGGRYEIWGTQPGKSTWTVQRVDALQEIAGSLSDAQRAAAIGKVGVSYKSFLPAKHAAKMDQLISLTNQVPTSRAADRVGMRPALDAIFRVENGKVVPYGWFKDFLSALSPARSLFATSSSKAFSVKPQARVQQQTQQQTQQQVQQPPPEIPMPEPSGGVPTPVLVVGGLVLVGGIAYFATRK